MTARYGAGESVERRSRRAVVVTGASSGIGRALALGLAADGFEVFGTVRGEAAARSLAAASAGAVTPVEMDVTDAGQVAAAARAVAAATEGRGLYALVNNAGVDLPGPIETFALDRLRHQLEVNTVGVVAVTQALLPALVAGRGRVVNIGSIGARVVLPFNGPYSASKAALAVLTTAWRAELRPRGVDACLVEVGNVRTPIWEKVQRGVEGVAGDVAAAGDRAAAAAYTPALHRGTRLVARMARAASAPEVVVRAVRRALHDRRPRATYVAGTDARAWRLVAWTVPAGLLEWGMARVFGLSSVGAGR